MKVLQINTFGNLSTGKIAVDIYRTLKAHGHDGLVAFARNQIAEDVPYIHCGNIFSVYTDGVLSRLTDRAGFFSKAVTRNLIDQIKVYDPDIVQLHNLHGYYINVPILFEFLRESKKPIVWTLHDCWAYTGHCCYYSMAECDKWKTECRKCPQRTSYPASLFIDQSARNYRDKKQIILSTPELNLVCVSRWLEKEVKNSFLKDMPTRVIYNGIDTNVFRPTEGDFRKRYNLENKKIILGVASTWDTRKGLKDFIELSQIIDNGYQIVLVGLSENEKKSIPGNIIGIGRTDGPKELADIYSSSDVYFNASSEETFGLPTVEALACGTPVVVYNSTGIPETVRDGEGYIVKLHDLNQVVEKIKKICESDLRVPVSDFQFSKDRTYEQYLKLYEELL